MAQVWRAQRTFHVIACVIFMRSCCVFDSPRLSLPLLAVYLLSYRPVHPFGLQLLLPRCGGLIPIAHSLMRTLAPLRSTLSHKVSAAAAAAASECLDEQPGVCKGVSVFALQAKATARVDVPDPPNNKDKGWSSKKK